jgi:hypothetical protein
MWSDRWQNPVIEMTTSAPVSYLAPQFDDFLFARIDEDSDATPLSVLSVLARLGVDPWAEAAKLAQLPRLSAAERLVAFIAATPSAPSVYLNAKTVCDRLIDLLPSPAGVTSPPRPQQSGRTPTMSQYVIWPLVIAVLLAIQLIAITRQPASEPQAASSSTVLP